MTPAAPRRKEFDDVVPPDLPPATLTENARIVLGKRYLKKDALPASTLVGVEKLVHPDLLLEVEVVAAV